MRKVLPLLLALMLTLTACTPTEQAAVTVVPTGTEAAMPFPSTSQETTVSHTLEIDVDEDHHFWIEMMPADRTENAENVIPVTVSVYDPQEKNKLVQTWEDVCYLYTFDSIRLYAGDVDFDGDMDLVYSSRLAAHTAGDTYWVWDGERFVRDPYGLEELSWPEFDAEREVISSWGYSGGFYWEYYYRYIGGELTCIRKLDRQDTEPDGEYNAVLIVEDYIDGELVEVYREETASTVAEWPGSEEFDRWHDLDYHGEAEP